MHYIDSEEPEEYLDFKGTGSISGDHPDVGCLPEEDGTSGLAVARESGQVGGEVFWFALSAPYRREMRAKELFDTLGIETFVPMRKCMEDTGRGKRKRVLRPAVSNLLFVRCTRRKIQDFKTRYPIVQYITRPIGGRNEPIIVPDRQMEDFQRAITETMETILYFQPSEIDLRRGKRVRIIGGVLNGVTGTLMKVKGARSRRLVILLEGLGAVAAEVEPDYIELI